MLYFTYFFKKGVEGMAKRARKNREPRVIQGPPDPISSENMPVAPPRQQLNFGLLKTRKRSIKQSTMPLNVSVKRGSDSANFGRQSNANLIKIIHGDDLQQIRELSKWFANNNGIYQRAVRYLADLCRFDYVIYPNLDLNIELGDKNNDKILKGLNAVLEHFDNSAVQLMCRRWAHQVCLEGVVYGILCDDIGDKLVIQDLPSKYCRSRFFHRGLPMVEFNAEYFEKVTNDENLRKQILMLFPKEIQDGYKQYVNKKLQPEFQGDKEGWFLLPAEKAFKFNFNDSDRPPFLSAIPSLLELNEVHDLEKEKLIQELQKILVQQYKLDKNDQIPFTMDELTQLNENAIAMVGDAVGVNVLSTVADVSLEDLSPNTKEGKNNIEVAENSAFNDLGISTNLFNASGNLSLEKSIQTDESFIKPLIHQFELFLNNYIESKFNKTNMKYRLKMLMTTIFNYVQISDKYKDLTKLGFSRFLPMVALGHTQKEVISLAKFEQQILALDNWMLPPFSSNTMSSDTWTSIKQIQKDGGLVGERPVQDQSPIINKEAADQASKIGENQGGRPEKPESEKSDKTIANISSQG